MIEPVPFFEGRNSVKEHLRREFRLDTLSLCKLLIDNVRQVNVVEAPAGGIFLLDLVCPFIAVYRNRVSLRAVGPCDDHRAHL